MSDKPASPARGRKKTAPPAQQPPQEEVVVRLPLADLYPFPDHPFQVRDDEEMRETIQSVKEYGVIVPAIVRPREEGGYEIVAGHRRKYACEQAGLDTMPVLIRNLDRDAATIIMVDSNLQRENILPSENDELMNVGSLPLWMSLGCQQADFCIAPCPEAKAVKPAIGLLVLFQPDESNAFVGEAPSLDQPERLRELRESGP